MSEPLKQKYNKTMLSVVH